MSSAFEKAMEWIKKESSSGKSFATLQASMPEFRDGQLVVNKLFMMDPLLLGYSGKNVNITIDDSVVRAVTRIGKAHGLETVIVPPDLHLVRDGKINGIVRPNGFAAANAKLFEDIAREIYGIGGTPMRNVGIKDKWLDSIALLLADKKLVETLFFALLFILLPPTLAAYSLLITSSLIVPDIVRYGVVVLMLLAAIYIARLYVRENLKGGR